MNARDKRIAATVAAADHYFGLVHASCSLQEFVALKLSCSMPVAGKRIQEAGGINALRDRVPPPVSTPRPEGARPKGEWFVLLTVAPDTNHGNDHRLVGPFDAWTHAQAWRDRHLADEGTIAADVIPSMAPY